MESLSIGDSGFLVYSSITTSVPVEAFMPRKGYVGWMDFGVKWCSTGLVTSLKVDGVSTTTQSISGDAKEEIGT